MCESSLWETLGFIYFDQLDSKDKIAKANFYYGQLLTIKEIKLFSNWIKSFRFKYYYSI